MWHGGETGLLGLAIDPNFRNNRWVYTCHGYEVSGSRDIRVVRWQINRGWTAATNVGPLITGIQIVSGRHGGCRLRFAPNGALYVGTGDAAVGTNPQDLTSLNGKTLRIDRNGDPWPRNPFISEPNTNTKKVFTYGHRNVQGLAWRPKDRMWSAEHGTWRDDEVNRLKAGGNYGWDPGPDYDESTPMTDHSLPGRQIDAKWSSGSPTIATSGMSWLRGPGWEDWQGSLAVCALAEQELRILTFGPKGTLISDYSVPEFDGDFGRIRAAQMGPGRALYVTTDNGGGNDRILKVTPS
jgi:glucose/arabinose dehydrogenase